MRSMTDEGGRLISNPYSRASSGLSLIRPSLTRGPPSPAEREKDCIL